MALHTPLSLLDLPQELLRKIAVCTIVDCSLGRPPRELVACLRTCHSLNRILSPENANELYYLIFSRQFDARGPVYRLSEPVVRENAPHEIRRRFQAIQVFQSRDLYHPGLTEALWIAYLMVEDSDTSQKNIKQLLRAQLPSFLDRYLRERLYEGAEHSGGLFLPVITEQNSLAIALSWTLASNRVLSYEDRDVCKQMLTLLSPIVFIASRYSIFHHPESIFTYSGAAPIPAPEDLASIRSPPSIIPPQDIYYFGLVKRQARPPSAAIFAALLYSARLVRLLTNPEGGQEPPIPSHIQYETREQASQAGYVGTTVEDVKHYYERCGTRFADFPGFDVGVHSAAQAMSPDTILCQPSMYQIGRLSGQWQGAYMFYTYHDVPGMRKPAYLTLEEHFCYHENSVVPRDDRENGISHAWLPQDIQSRRTKTGMQFFDAKGNFNTTYETYHLGVTKLRRGKQIADVIITGKTEERYINAWGGPPLIIGRVRLHDGLMILHQYHPDISGEGMTRLLCGYVTSSRNLVGRSRGTGRGAVEMEGVFSLGMDNAQTPARTSYSMFS